MVTGPCFRNSFFFKVIFLLIYSSYYQVAINYSAVAQYTSYNYVCYHRYNVTLLELARRYPKAAESATLIILPKWLFWLAIHIFGDTVHVEQFCVLAFRDLKFCRCCMQHIKKVKRHQEWTLR